MTPQPFSIRSFPRAILLVDGDSFFATCEQAMNPKLRGKPVVTGQERGIASSMSIEAKKLGITRAMSLYTIRKKFPQCIILPSNYEAYSLYSLRMFDIVRRYTSVVEEYSIDECFADLTDMRHVFQMSYEQIAQCIQRELAQELDCSFSIGLAPSKTLAKLASIWRKPSGLTLIPARDAHTFLATTPIETIWGIGRATTAFLHAHEIRTAYDFASKDQMWVQRHLSSPQQQTWAELRGDAVIPFTVGSRVPKSISKVKTFTPPSRDRDYIFSQLSKNIENACIKARRHGVRTKHVAIMLKTQQFRYHGLELSLKYAVNTPESIVELARKHFHEVFHTDTEYRATGVFFGGLHAEALQPDLFGGHVAVEKTERIFAGVDRIAKKYGKHALFLGSSFEAMTTPAHKNPRELKPSQFTADRLFGESFRKHVGLPHLGSVS